MLGFSEATPACYWMLDYREGAKIGHRYRPTTPAIPGSTFTASGAATSPANRPPIPRPARPARARAKLSYAGHVLMENRNGIAVNGCMTQATGRAEPQAAMAMVEAIPRGAGAQDPPSDC